MVFTSHVFLLVFLPATLGAVLLARRLSGRGGVVVVLVVASLLFYGYWDWRYLSLLSASILFNYGFSRLLLRPYGERARCWLLGVGVGVNLAVLGFFKYADFFLANLGAALGRDVGALGIILPLGISFITFQKIAYLVDVWRDRPEPYPFLDYCLFVTFFPQLIAGPIVHHRELIPQLQRPDLGRLRLDGFNRGLVVFTIGMAKKILVADTIAVYADGVFGAAAAGTPLSAFEAWAGALAYALQLYFDFSGYADMAIGLGLMLGIRLPENFDRPYNARSITDFWRRWHLTLSRFLRDYLYVPLGGNRRGLPRGLANLLATMLLGGLWHGAAWAFVLWGLIHGLALGAHRLWARARARLPIPSVVPAAAGAPLAWALTFAVVLVAWVPFRAVRWESTLAMWQAMAAGPALPEAARAALGPAAAGWLEAAGVGIAGPLHLGLRGWAVGLPLLAAAMVLAVRLPNGHRLGEAVFRRLDAPGPRRGAAVAAGGALTAAGFVAALIYMSQDTVFLYYQF